MATLSGGKALEAKLAEIAKKMSGNLTVGFSNGATYPDGTLVAQVAFWSEFGHGGKFPSPARPFFRSMISKNSPSWGDRLAGAAKYTGYDAKKALSIMGETMVEELQESITSFAEPALSPTTLMLRSMFGVETSHEIKASDVLEAQRRVAAGETGVSGTAAHPLIWTGVMENQGSITYEIKGGD